MSEIENVNVEEVSFEQMLEDSLVTLHTGDVVKGTVIQVVGEEVSVNLGFKSDGVIPRGEFSRDTTVVPSQVVQPGDEIEVFVVRVNDGDGNVLLSRKRIEEQKGMEDIEKAFNEKTVVTGTVTDVVKGGLIAVVNGVRVFIPSSQVSNRFIEDLSVFKGQELEFNIIEMDRVKRRIIGGRKDLVEKEIAAKKAALFETIAVGSKIAGTVSRLTDFGAFVDLGGVDGLIHISEMSWGRISNPREVLKEGQEVEVFVLDVDKEKGKISLSLKDADKNPWKLAADKYAVGSIVEGKVVRMVPFGAFVELEPGVDGLVHISQIANKHVVKPEDELKVGEIINVKVLEVNSDQKKISLSKRQADAPVEEIEEIVRPCGLGKSKARDISACMRMLRDVYGGNVPNDFNALLKLPGVGRKSANLIMGDVFGKPAIVTDTHCIRLCNRIGLVDHIKEPKKVEMELWKIIPPEEGNDLCHRFVLHGRDICSARTTPHCEHCCLQDICAQRI